MNAGSKILKVVLSFTKKYERAVRSSQSRRGRLFERALRDYNSPFRVSKYVPLFKAKGLGNSTDNLLSCHKSQNSK